MQKPILPNGQLRPGFTKSEQSAVASQTYLHEEVVIQSRDVRFFDAWDLRMRLLQNIPDPDHLLLAAECQYEKDGDIFWVEYKRYDLPGSPAHKNFARLPAEEIERVFTESLEDVIRTEHLLRSCSLPKDLLLKLAASEIGKGHGVRIMSDMLVRDYLRAAGYKPLAPLPEESESALSHSDAIGKNIILTSDGFRLIDWEALGLYPKTWTLGHALSWTLLKLPTSSWEGFLHKNLPGCLQIMEVTEEEARRVIYWQMMRECLFWSGSQNRLGTWLESAAQII